jgi:Cysteine rich repeat
MTHICMNTAKPLDIELVIRGRSMKITLHSLARLAVLPLMLALSAGSASAQADIGKTIVEKLSAKVAKLESACAKDIKKYCTTVTPGEGRMIYCMQAHEDKISPQCDYELEESASNIQTLTDSLKDAVQACKAEIAGVCGKTIPGQGRIAACLMANRSTVSKGCEDAIQKVEALSAK